MTPPNSSDVRLQPVLARVRSTVSRALDATWILSGYAVVALTLSLVEAHHRVRSGVAQLEAAAVVP